MAREQEQYRFTVHRRPRYFTVRLDAWRPLRPFGVVRFVVRPYWTRIERKGYDGLYQFERRSYGWTERGALAKAYRWAKRRTERDRRETARRRYERVRTDEVTL